MTDVAALIEKLAKQEAPPLTQDELKEVRNFLEGVRAWRMVGKAVLWIVVTTGAIATAVGAIRGQGWFGGP